jgi:hypothetical protein
VVVHGSTSSSSRSPQGAYTAVQVGEEQQQHRGGAVSCNRSRTGVDPQHMTGLQRFKATCALWPYMVPLFVVYFAEVRQCVDMSASIFPATCHCSV